VHFNGLPAPWEALPDWFTSSTPTNATPTNGGGGDFTPPPQMAELQRDLPPPEPQSVATAEEEPMHQRSSTPGVEPDLDALARQVYILLRRRLASERRRFG
jgi:hypothetical protein